MMVLEHEFDLGDLVVLKTDPEKDERIVLQITVVIGGCTTYMLGYGPMYTTHYPQEIDFVRKAEEKEA
jgi:hypothetical protein